MLARAVRTAEVVGIAIAVALVGLWAARWVGATQERERAEKAALVANGQRLADAYRAERRGRALERAEARVETVTVAVERRSARADTVLAGIDSVLADSAATVPVLRAQLTRARTEFAAFRAEVDTLIAAHAAYRLAVERRLALADSTIEAQARAIAALRKKPPLLRRLVGLACEGGVTAGGTALGALGGQPVLGAVGGLAIGKAACP